MTALSLRHAALTSVAVIGALACSTPAVAVPNYAPLKVTRAVYKAQLTDTLSAPRVVPGQGRTPVRCAPATVSVLIVVNRPLVSASGGASGTKGFTPLTFTYDNARVNTLGTTQTARMCVRAGSRRGYIASTITLTARESSKRVTLRRFIAVKVR